MRRREFIALVGGATAAWPIVARAQQSAMPVVGFMSSRSPDEAAVHTAAFRSGLSEAGFVEGKNVSVIFRWAEGRYERLPAIARELVDLRVSAILAGGGEPSARAAQAATTRIPVVFVIGDDPVSVGLTASYNRPGGNLTGVSFITGELGGKRLDLICEMVQGSGSVALLLNPNVQNSELQRREVQAAAQRLGRPLLILYAAADKDVETTFETLKREHAQALIVQNDPFFDSRRERIISLAARYNLPAIYHIREFPAGGGLVSYGASLADTYRQAGNYMGRILLGEKPGDLPIIQPTKFELVINLKTAKALGLTVSPSLIVRADEVIE